MSKKDKTSVAINPADTEPSKLMKTQYKQDKEAAQQRNKHIVFIIIAVGGSLALVLSAFSQNPELPKIAGTVLISLLSYLAGRSSR